MNSRWFILKHEALCYQLHSSAGSILCPIRYLLFTTYLLVTKISLVNNFKNGAAVWDVWDAPILTQRKYSKELKEDLITVKEIKASNSK